MPQASNQFVQVEPLPDQMCSAGLFTPKPIIPATGEKFYLHADYQGEGPHPLSLSRSFRSRWSSASAPAWPAKPGLGQSWSHNHAASLIVEGATITSTATSHATSARLIQGDASSTRFSWDSAATRWTPSDAGGSGLIANTIPATGVPGYLLTQAEDDSRWQFDAAGKLLSKTERNGWTTTYSYNTTGPNINQLSQVSNAFGRSMQFGYTAAGQLSSISTPDGQSISYAFDGAGRLSSVAYPGNVVKTYLYEDSRWPQSVTGIIDERGLRLATVVYDAQGRATQSGYALGADQYSVAYPGSTDAPTQVTDPLGTTRSYRYGSTLGKLAVTGASLPSAYADSGGSDAASRVQNAAGLIDSETDFLGIQTLYSWDSTRRLPLSTTLAAGRPEASTTSTQWHSVWRLPVRITEPGRSTAYTYDGAGNPLSQTVTDASSGPSNGQSRSWAWSYTAQGLLASQTDPLGHSWSYAYDTQGNRVSSTDPLGQTTAYSYDGAGRLSSQSEPGGLLTSLGYDSRGRLTSLTLGGETSLYAYTPAGQLEGASLSSGYAVTYRYDAAQRLIGASDNRGNRISYTLDAMGNRLHEEVQDASNSIALATSRTINSLNRVSSIANSQGNRTQFGFDANGQTTSASDPLNQTTSQSLDAVRRPTSTTLADNSRTSTAWSALGDLAQPVSATDPKGITTSYQRNAWGEVLSETSPDSGTTTYTRDTAGNVTAKTDANGQTSRYSRDALGRATSITLADGTQQQLAYDAAGNLSQLTDPSGTTHYSRDSLGRILQKTQSVNDHPANPSTTTTGYAYHSGGAIAQLSYPSGLTVYYRQSSSGQTSQIDVQPPGLIKALKPITPFVSNLSYSALGQPRAWNWSSGDSASRVFDADGRMVSSELASYQFDAASRITGVTQNLWALQEATAATATTPATAARLYTTPITWTAGYDSRNRLTRFARNSASTQYTLDANSNRLSSLDTTSADTDLDGDFDQFDYQKTQTQALNIEGSSNRLLGFSQTQSIRQLNKKDQPVIATSSTQVSYSLDAAGNLTSDGLRSFQYDSANRLSAVQIGHNLEASKVSYLHNALGQRVFKSEPQVAQTAPSEEELGTDFVSWLKKNFGWLFAEGQRNATLGQSFVYGDGPLGSYNLLGEYSNGGSKSAGRMEFIWLPTETGQAIPVGLYRNHRFYAIHADHLGTPRLITDDANRVVWQWAYSAFGENKPTEVLKATTNPKAAMVNVPTLLKATTPGITMNLRFAGQYADEESKLSYNFWRSYMAGQGRFSQSDPLGLGGGWSRYSYVGGNPLSFTDPMGLYTEVVVWQGVGIGSSSFGHVSTNVNGQNFSWGPGGWDKQSATAAEYNKRQQDFRGGTGVMLNLSPQQEAALASCMRASNAEYGAVTNNCGNPVQQCLNAVGAGVGNSVLPSSILENLRSSPNSNGSVSYPSPRPSSGFGGGLLWR